MDLLTKCRHNLQHRHITSDTTVLQDVMATCRVQTQQTDPTVRARTCQAVRHTSVSFVRPDLIYKR